MGDLTHCPLCGAKIVHQGLNDVECENFECANGTQLLYPDDENTPIIPCDPLTEEDFESLIKAIGDMDL